MRLQSSLVIAAGAIVALAAWPSVALRQPPVAAITPAPVMRDYLLRDQYIAFYEKQTRAAPTDQIELRMLAQLYMQRFRERYDFNDVTRAERFAKRSIELQPQGNTSAQMTLAGALLSYHDFADALDHERAALEGEPSDVNAKAQIASLEMELGAYHQAKQMLDGIAGGGIENPTVDSVRARYEELTGALSDARASIDRAIRTIDSGIDNPAYDRSWYHMRAGQLAFEAGDFEAAERELNTSLQIFPENAMTLMWEARVHRARKEWDKTISFATRSADLYPLPQTLGYEADAQRALGNLAAAAKTDALIEAEERIFNAQGVNDRLLANYYAARHRHLDAALLAARNDYRKRGDEIYSDDTMGWVLAAMDRWREARHYAELAVRYGTQDAELEYHAAVISMHTRHLDEAKRRLALALAQNPSFDPFEADDARSLLNGMPAKN